MEQIKEVREIIAVRCPLCSVVKEIGHIERIPEDGDYSGEDKLIIYDLPHSECPEISEEEVFLEG